MHLGLWWWVLELCFLFPIFPDFDGIFVMLYAFLQNQIFAVVRNPWCYEGLAIHSPKH